MAYLTNNQRLDLGLVGQSDVPVPVIQAAIGKHPGVYVQGVVAAVPTGGGGGAGTVKAARR